MRLQHDQLIESKKSPMNTSTQVNGYVAEGFEAVREIFATNLSSGEELGATFSVVKDGEIIIDLYGGVRDEAKSEALGPDDLFNVWSTTKGLCALCLAMAVDRGLKVCAKCGRAAFIGLFRIKGVFWL